MGKPKDFFKRFFKGFPPKPKLPVCVFCGKLESHTMVGVCHSSCLVETLLELKRRSDENRKGG